MSELTRRNVLRCIGGGAVGAGLAGKAAAAGDGDRLVLGTRSTDGARFAAQRADGVEEELDFGERGNAVVGRFSEAAVADLERRGELRYVERDVTFHTLGEFETAAQSDPWGIERVGAVTAHEQGHTGDGAHIAVVDSGIDSDHPDLAPNLGEGYAVEECDGFDCNEPWDDDHSHGTHCAGIANAVNNGSGVVGVATNATLHGVKVMTKEGRGTGSGVAGGIKWAADQGYEVISMSLGATSPSSVVHDAVRYATEQGTLVVAAAGNEGPCIDCVHYPGAYDEAVAVGATNSEDELSEFSSTGPEVEIAAPGTDITSCVIGGGYQTYSGTSMATPHVAGAAALLAAQGLSNTEIRAQLTETAEDLGYGDRETGAGLLNVDAAVEGGPAGEFGVTTGTPTGVGPNSATLQGTLTGLGDHESAAVGFTYRHTSADGGETVAVGEVSSTGAFEAPVEGLEKGTEYVVVATAEAPDGSTVSGDPVTFSTSNGLAVTTAEPAEVESTAATLKGELTGLGAGGEASVSCRCWVAGEKEATLVATDPKTKTETGSFEGAVGGLDPETEYVAVAVAAGNSEVTGEEVRFTTSKESQAPFTVETLEADWINDWGARLNGEITDLGGVREVETGFEVWPTGDKGSAIQEDAEDVDEVDDFDEMLMGLESDTDYTAVAYAYDPDDPETVGYGAPVEFTTEPRE
ncbi:S8 family peptidase [Halobium salinum]|uniref:S8 family peptidase n=1 Tax=Halobium salinum TaxID=1364940 RepID=A0ABD5PB42_9EURY|nr:S8 family peptidase [Halobium salinum]